MVDERMKYFLKRNNFTKTSAYIDESIKGNFDEIFRKYQIDLKKKFPGLECFSSGQKAHFKNKGKILFKKKYI